jgi:hypothetical protein
MWTYSEAAVDELIRDYRKDFGVHLLYDDAMRMILLIDLLAEVFEKYEGEFGSDNLPAFVSRLLEG